MALITDHAGVKVVELGSPLQRREALLAEVEARHAALVGHSLVRDRLINMRRQDLGLPQSWDTRELDALEQERAEEAREHGEVLAADPRAAFTWVIECDGVGEAVNLLNWTSTGPLHDRADVLGREPGVAVYELEEDESEEGAWQVRGDLRPRGSGLDSDANHDAADLATKRFPAIMVDAEMSEFFATAPTREAAIELASLLNARFCG